MDIRVGSWELDIKVGTLELGYWTLDFRVGTWNVEVKLCYAKNVPETLKVSLDFESCVKNQLEIETSYSRERIVRYFSH